MVFPEPGGPIISWAKGMVFWGGGREMGEGMVAFGFAREEEEYGSLRIAEAGLRKLPWNWCGTEKFTFRNPPPKTKFSLPHSPHHSTPSLNDDGS